MAGGLSVFKIETAWSDEAKRHERAVVIVCGKCGHRATVADSAAKHRPGAYFADKFRRKAWRVGAQANGHVCPRCIGGIKPKAPAKPLSPAQKRAAFCRIAGVAPAKTKTATIKGADMPKPATPPATGAPAAPPVLSVVADAPRLPTREDKRAIREALDACYLTDKGVYAGEDSDQRLADRLKVPRAWVSAEREDAYGPDACEADGADLKLLPGLVERADLLEREGMALAERAEALRLEIRKIEGRLAKRGVA